MKQQLLLLHDVDSLGKKGEIVTAKPGYVRNFLLPRGYAVIASENTLRKQEKLRQERKEQAIIDRKASEELALQIQAKPLETYVKVDPEGHMYGSVSNTDIAALFEEQGLNVEKKAIAVTKPIKQTGVHKILIHLKEGVDVSTTLSIIPEGGFKVKKEEPIEKAPVQAADQENGEEEKTDEEPAE